MSHLTADVATKAAQQQMQQDKARAEWQKRAADEMKSFITEQVKEAQKGLETKVSKIQTQLNTEMSEIKQKLAFSGGGNAKDLQEATEKIKDECSRYFARMNQTDIKVQAGLNDIKALTQSFEQKQESLRTQLIKVGNTKGHVTAQLSHFEAKLKALEDFLNGTVNR